MEVPLQAAARHADNTEAAGSVRIRPFYCRSPRPDGRRSGTKATKITKITKKDRSVCFVIFVTFVFFVPERSHRSSQSSWQ